MPADGDDDEEHGMHIDGMRISACVEVQTVGGAQFLQSGSGRALTSTILDSVFSVFARPVASDWVISSAASPVVGSTKGCTVTSCHSSSGAAAGVLISLQQTLSHPAAVWGGSPAVPPRSASALTLRANGRDRGMSSTSPSSAQVEHMTRPRATASASHIHVPFRGTEGFDPVRWGTGGTAPTVVAGPPPDPLTNMDHVSSRLVEALLPDAACCWATVSMDIVL